MDKVTNNHSTTSIHYRGTISRQLFLRAQSHHMGLRWLLLLFFPALFAVYIWGWLQNVPFTVKLLTTLIAGTFVPLMIILQRWQWNRLFNRSPYLREPIRGVISEWSLRTENSMGMSDIPWELFTKRKDQGDLILLYQGPNLFNVIAAEFFDSSDDWENARKKISEKMKPSRA